MHEEALAVLLRGGTEVSVPAGGIVFRQGNHADHYLVVTRGSVRVFARSADGREIVLYRVCPGEMCTLTTACLLGGSEYPAEAVAETEAVACALPAERFRALIEDSPEFRAYVFASFSGRLSEIMQRLEELVLSSVDRKLARCLLANDAGDGVVRMTHEQLALEIGTAREVVSRHLKALESRGVVELRRGRVRLLDTEALRHQE